MCAIFQDNAQLCSELSDKVVQHFVHCIETHGRHVEYLHFLQTIVKAEGQFIRKCQDMVMQELVNVGEDVLVFYNDKASFNAFVEMMRAERHRLDADSSGALKYKSNIFIKLNIFRSNRIVNEKLEEKVKFSLFDPFGFKYFECLLEKSGTTSNWCDCWRCARWARTSTRKSSATVC